MVWESLISVGKNNFFYNIVHKNKKLSLETIGLLSLILEKEEDHFKFLTREMFLDYFRIPSHYLCEKLFSDLIEAGIVDRKVRDGLQIYTINKVIIEVPLSYSENKVINRYIKEELEKFNDWKSHVAEIFEGFKENLEHRNIELKLHEAEQFFDVFRDSEPYLPSFMEIYYHRGLSGKKSLKYLKSILENIKAENKAVKKERSASSSLIWDDEKQRDMQIEFAKNLALGEAKDRKKYQVLIKKKEFDTLRTLYSIGKDLIDESKLYTEYEWLED